MKALISPKEYCDKKVLENENELLFSEIWNFVGFKEEFLQLNDFKTQEIAGIPVVIQNCKGKIKSFKNICSHRHSIIQVDKKGNRPLLCPYHGWAYNDKGLPFGIPKKPLFNFSTEEMECLKLREYKVDFCGNLVFVNINNDSSETLIDYLGSFYSEIEKMSENFGELIDVNEMVIDANWKILVENTLESYHVNLIHEETFKRLGADGLDFDFENAHSSWNASLLLKENEGKQKKVHQPYQNRMYTIEGYKHLLVFPNILISTTYGVSFNLSQILPLDENKSLFRSFVFLTQNVQIDKNEAIESMYKNSLINFNRKVFEEDKVICEKVQLGVKTSSFQGELSDEEKRVSEFQKNYKKYLKHENTFNWSNLRNRIRNFKMSNKR
jgi:phenylpropionate dioxygenase-like ring-hydroxylating dioxygenase large terminal subunit